jgi:hypothetical protein
MSRASARLPCSHRLAAAGDALQSFARAIVRHVNETFGRGHQHQCRPIGKRQA